MITRTLRKVPDIYALLNIRAIDGDTIEASICLPFDVHITKRIRLKGWYSDEHGGPWHAQALVAQQRLQTYCNANTLWLHSPSCRMDKYGRIIGHLMHGTRFVIPKDVLGDLQLTERVHRDRRTDKARQIPRPAPNPANVVPGAEDEPGPCDEYAPPGCTGLG